jgi:hypothetical protein
LGDGVQRLNKLKKSLRVLLQSSACYARSILEAVK